MTNVPTTTVKSDRQEANEFLDALFGRHLADHEEFIEVRFLTPDKKGIKGRAVSPTGQFDKKGWDDLLRRAKDCHIVFGVNPRTNMERGRAEDIETVVCLWADVDGKDFEDGGKEAALRSVEAFPLRPTIIVDSGHGYHCYWVLAKPLDVPVETAKEKRLEVRQTVKGLLKALKGDCGVTDLSRCLRLPGTMNIKPGTTPVQCFVHTWNKEVTYSLADFASYRDTSFREAEGSNEPIPEFGDRNLLVSAESEKAALDDVAELREVDDRILKAIRTGRIGKKKADGSEDRSRRDITIIRALIKAGYGYATIKSIFLNPFLKCFDRIRERGEGDLQWDVKKALSWVERFKIHGTPQNRRIREIKSKEAELSADEQMVAIKEYVVGDLMTGPAALCDYFYQDKEEGPFWLWNRDDRQLIDTESKKFTREVENRYVFNETDHKHAQLAVVTHVATKGRLVEAHRYHYFDDKNFVLYFDNGDSGIYCLDGRDIKLVDNGDEERGLFFEDVSHELDGFDYLAEPAPQKYFRSEVMTDEKGNRYYQLGFSWEAFRGSLIDKYLISRASFADDEERGITAEEQKLNLLLWFYSLPFESIFTEKPLALFIGKMLSGKSFICTSVGQILFGRNFRKTSSCDNNDFLKTVLHEERYVVFDNLKRLDREMQGTLAAYTTDRPKMGRRTMYKGTQVRSLPRVFIAVTTCDQIRWEEDLMRRVLLFNTKKLNATKDPLDLWKPIHEHRSEVMSEYLANLNTIVGIHRMKRHLIVENPAGVPSAFFSFGQKVCSTDTREQLLTIMEKLCGKKSEIVLDENPLWSVIQYVMFERRDEESEEGRSEIEPMTPGALRSFLSEMAEEMKLKEFDRWYKTPERLRNEVVALQEAMAAKGVRVVGPIKDRNQFRWGFERIVKKEEGELVAGVPSETVARWEPTGVDKAMSEAIMQEAVTPPATEEDLAALEKMVEEQELEELEKELAMLEEKEKKDE